MSGVLEPTAYFQDFIAYYEKAAILQRMNLASATGRDVTVDPGFHDPLMQYVTIYDCVERRYAGFSNALQQLWWGSANPKRWQARDDFDGLHDRWTELEWFFVMLVHRVTGSGASFAKDHGFRNSIVANLPAFSQAGEMKRFVLDEMRRGRPIFTSIGNQIAPFPRPRADMPGLPKGSMLYLSEYAPGLAYDTLTMLQRDRQYGAGQSNIDQLVDWTCEWHKRHGLKQFKFVLTAWCMDLAEYFPQYVNPQSHVHYGKNAIETMELLFKGSGFKSRDVKYRAIMDKIRETVQWVTYDDGTTGPNRPYSIEDVLCDYVRFLECYVPKGYEHLEPWQVQNSSTAGHEVRHASYDRLVGSSA